MKFIARTAIGCMGVFFAVTAGREAKAATNEWIGPVGGDRNWSLISNWSLGAVPTASDTVKFAKPGPPNTVQTNSIVDKVFGNSIEGLQLQTTTGNFGIFVSSGQVLSVGGDLTCGNNSSSPATNFIMGSGAGLVVSNSPPTNNIIIGNWSLPGPLPKLAFDLLSANGLDLSGLDYFSASVARVRIADGLAYNTPEHVCAKGNLILAKTNMIVASDIGVGVAGYTNVYQYSGGEPVFFVLGQSNLIWTDTITVGADLVSSRMVFNEQLADSAVQLRGKHGTNRIAEFRVGDGHNRSDVYPFTAHQSFADFSSGTVDLLADSLLIGNLRTNAGSGSVSALARGRMRFARGRVDVNSLQLGRALWELAGGHSEGSVEVGSSGELVVNSAIEMGRNTLSRKARGIISIEGGTVMTPFINANYNSQSNTITMTNGTLIVSNTMGPGILDFVMVDSILQLPAMVTPSAIVTNLVTSGTANVINVGSTVGLYSYPTQVVLIKYQGVIGGAGFDFTLGTLPTPVHLGFLSNNTANSSVDVILDLSPTLTAAAGGNELALTLTGPSNRVVDILTSTNLSDWNPFATLTNASGVSTLLDSTTNGAQRFFRARQRP